jgi:hypothetical protein
MSNYLALLNFNLTSINASTISYSTLIGSTVIASSTIIANSTINVSSIVSRSINYSTIMGSTINANTVSIVSTITTSSILATGNVGIGTNAAGYALDIGTLGATGGLQIRNGSANNAIGVSAYPQIIMSYNGTSSNAHWIATRHNGGAGAGNAIDFYMWTAGQSGSLGSTLMMSVTSLGVGIGITNPSNLLTVGASANPISNSAGTTNLVVNGNINCNRNRLIFSGTAIDRNHSIYNNFFNLDNEGVWDGMKFNVFNGAWFRVGNTTALYINSTGSVGIKTSTPIAVLDTVGTIRSLDATYAALSGGTGLELYYSGGGNIVSGTRNAGSLTTAALAYLASTHSFNVGTGGGTNGLFITSSGTVGINTTTTGAYTLNVTGSIYATGDITALSDKRKKDNIIPLTQSLDLLAQLTGYSYTRSDLNNKENIGLIAQEVKEVFPQAVTYDDELGLYSLNYGCLIAPVIQAIKELKQTVDRQDEIIKILLDHYGPPQ